MKRAPNSTIVLMPDPGRRNRPDAYRNGISDMNGVITFNDVPPGDYMIIGWKDVPTGAWENPTFLRRFEDDGVPVRLDPSSREQSAVTVVR